MRWRWELVKAAFGPEKPSPWPLPFFRVEPSGPPGMLVTAEMSPERLREYEIGLNDLLEYSTERHRAKFLEPPSVGLSIGDIWSQSAIERPVD